MIQDPNSPNILVFCFKNNKNSPWDLMMCPLRDATDGSLWDAMDGPLWDVADDPLWDAMDVFSKLLPWDLADGFIVRCNKRVFKTFTVTLNKWFIVGCNEHVLKGHFTITVHHWTWWTIHCGLEWTLKLLDCNEVFTQQNVFINWD